MGASRSSSKRSGQTAAVRTCSRRTFLSLAHPLPGDRSVTLGPNCRALDSTFKPRVASTGGVWRAAAAHAAMLRLPGAAGFAAIVGWRANVWRRTYAIRAFSQPYCSPASSPADAPLLLRISIIRNSMRWCGKRFPPSHCETAASVHPTPSDRHSCFPQMRFRSSLRQLAKTGDSEVIAEVTVSITMPPRVRDKYFSTNSGSGCFSKRFATNRWLPAGESSRGTVQRAQSSE